jgi:hypothetical protein
LLNVCVGERDGDRTGLTPIRTPLNNVYTFKNWFAVF